MLICRVHICVAGHFHASAALYKPAIEYAMSMVFEWMLCIHPSEAVGSEKRPVYHKVVAGYVQPPGALASASVRAGDALRELEWEIRGANRERFDATVKAWAQWFAVSMAKPALLTEAGKAMQHKMSMGQAKAPEIWFGGEDDE